MRIERITVIQCDENGKPQAFKGWQKAKPVYRKRRAAAKEEK